MCWHRPIESAGSLGEQDPVHEHEHGEFGEYDNCEYEEHEHDKHEHGQCDKHKHCKHGQREGTAAVGCHTE